MSGPRSTHTYQTARQACIDTGAANHTPCAWCGRPIDYQLPGTHRWGPTADHIHELARGGPITGPLRPMHQRCNAQRGAQLAAQLRQRQPSRQWLPGF